MDENAPSHSKEMLSDSPGSNNWLKEAKIGEFSWAILIPGIPPGSQEAARAAAD